MNSGTQPNQFVGISIWKSKEDANKFLAGQGQQLLQAIKPLPTEWSPASELSTCKRPPLQRCWHWPRGLFELETEKQIPHRVGAGEGVVLLLRTQFPVSWYDAVVNSWLSHQT